MVYRITLPGQFVSKLSKVFSVLMHLDPCLEITWISLYPLIDPQPGRDAKFPNYQHINNLITQVNSETNKSVSSAGFRVFNVSAYFPNLSPEMSSDTVHLSKRFDMYLVRELLNISTVGAAISKSKALLENHTIDQSVSSMVSCGERRTQLPGRGEELLVVFFGGSVTSDGRMIAGFMKTAHDMFGWNVKAVNAGEPGTDSTYQSYCWQHNTGQNISDAKIIVVEYCANDHDLETKPLRRLLLGLSSIKSSPFIVYYCHRSPKNRFKSTIPDIHWELVKTLGIAAVTNLFILENTLKVEEELMFRDPVHLTPFGGAVSGELILRTFSKCAQEPLSSALKESPTREQHAEETLLKHSELSDENRTTCFSSLGQESYRNLRSIASGWPFIQSKHVSAPNGKNGFEGKVGGSCLTINANTTKRFEKVILFYLKSRDADMGKANVTVESCDGFSQVVDGHTESPVSVTRAQLLSIPRNCALTGSVSRGLNVCKLGSGDRFRVVALVLTNE